MRALKRDSVEPQIVAALEAAGCGVLRGFEIDLLVWRQDRLWALEVKSGRGKLTPCQKRLKARGCPIQVVRTPEEALRAVGLLVSA